MWTEIEFLFFLQNVGGGAPPVLITQLFLVIPRLELINMVPIPVGAFFCGLPERGRAN